MAKKILIKDIINIKYSYFMDILPLSLGINVRNKSNNPEIKKEGDKMSIIIERGSKIPFEVSRIYQISNNCETNIEIKIFEGEKKYTKYNHFLGRVLLYNLPKKNKAKIKIEVKFFIDIEGILSITATEKESGEYVSTKIINDSIALTEYDIEKLREKNKDLYINKNKVNKQNDYSNLKEILKELQDDYIDSTDEEEKYDILKNYNIVLEEFINLFDKDFDNETMLEKYYIYVKIQNFLIISGN